MHIKYYSYSSFCCWHAPWCQEGIELMSPKNTSTSSSTEKYNASEADGEKWKNPGELLEDLL